MLFLSHYLFSSFFTMLCILLLSFVSAVQIRNTLSSFELDPDVPFPHSPQISYLPKHCGTFESDCEKNSLGSYSKKMIVFNGTESGNPYSAMVETMFYDDENCLDTLVSTQKERFVIDTVRDHRKYRLVPKESTIQFHASSLLMDRCVESDVKVGKEYYLSGLSCLSELSSKPTMILTSFQTYYLDIISVEDGLWREYYPVTSAGCIEDDKTYCGTYQRCEEDNNFSFLLTTKITGGFGKQPVDIRFDKDEHYGNHCNDSQIMRAYAFNVSSTAHSTEYLYSLHHVYIRITGDWWESSWNCEQPFVSGKEYDVMALNCTSKKTGEDAFAYLKGRIGSQGRMSLSYTNSTVTHNWDGQKATMDLVNWDGCTFCIVCYTF